MSGKFFVFEGPNGAGKSTLIAAVAEALVLAGKKVVQTREPGGTKFGEALRPILKAEAMLDFPRALAMNAARSHHYAEVISQGVADGKIVLCDRFVPSTDVYQVILGRLSTAEKDCVEAIHRCVAIPDHIFFLLPSVATILVRRQQRNGVADVDVFEAEASRERTAYLLAAQIARDRLWPMTVLDEKNTAAEIVSVISRSAS